MSVTGARLEGNKLVIITNGYTGGSALEDEKSKQINIRRKSNG